jgi:hypothetical protein
VCLVLFTLNAVICWPLFWAEYLDDFQSNEGSFITFGKFLLDSWPHCRWFPLFNAGMPFENTYLPLVSGLVAIGSAITRCSPAHVFHFLAALGFCLGPVFLFLFARQVSRRVAPSLLAALIWSLLSPAALIPRILDDMGTPWGSRRLQNIVFYGETPHNLSLSLLPLALLLLSRLLDQGNARRFALCVLAAATVITSNAFGVVVICSAFFMLVITRDDLAWRRLFAVGAILVSAYLLTCRLLPPSLMRLIGTNSQLIGGDFRLTWRTSVFAALFLLAIAALWVVTRRLPGQMLRFAILFSGCFGGITVLAFWKDLSFVPQPHRYHVELEFGLSLLTAFTLDPIIQHLAILSPPRAAKAVAASAGAAVLVFLGWVAVRDYRYARRLIHPVEITQTVPFQEARWIDKHFPSQRVLVSGEYQLWFNLFAANPQLSAGHEPSAPNWMQRVAVYTIYSGENAGDEDGPISVFWLKAFGCHAVTVPGPGSRDQYHPIRRPKKFDGLLPLVWRSGDDLIYQVPLRSTSLAHVIPIAAVVSRQPVHGLDIGPGRAFVAALEDPTLPPATLDWENPERGRILASLAPGQVVSVQETYDPGWRATVGGRPVRVRRDELGMIIIEADCLGQCEIVLEFTEGVERTICLALALAMGFLLLAMLLRPTRTQNLRMRPANG